MSKKKEDQPVIKLTKVSDMGGFPIPTDEVNMIGKPEYDRAVSKEVGEPMYATAVVISFRGGTNTCVGHVNKSGRLFIAPDERNGGEYTPAMKKIATQLNMEFSDGFGGFGATLRSHKSKDEKVLDKFYAKSPSAHITTDTLPNWEKYAGDLKKVLPKMTDPEIIRRTKVSIKNAENQIKWLKAEDAKKEKRREAARLRKENFKKPAPLVRPTDSKFDSWSRYREKVKRRYWKSTDPQERKRLRKELSVAEENMRLKN